MIGLRHLGLLKAPTLGLMDQHGSPWALSRTRGKVVVLSFLNAECNDLCPVQAQEISQADHLLGTRAASVEFVVVNSDPLETSLVVTPPALTQTGLSASGLPLAYTQSVAGTFIATPYTTATAANPLSKT